MVSNKVTHTDMNTNCIISLNATDKEICDKHYIWGRNGVKGYNSLAFSALSCLFMFESYNHNVLF